ncbi:hypothetical protein F2Q68_00005542 [Brassica cretica]|uniref:Uncharacterized protein n=1 Tax=Brassica cretica TaxID=69181 RepID=A0A8S9J8F4_BRACR|nr:hypothetical protein F2Q68_00005542 [Brassica cretica]
MGQGKSLCRYKGVGRVDGELGKATSQLDQLERSSKPQVKWFSSTSWGNGTSDCMTWSRFRIDLGASWQLRLLTSS